MDTRQYLATALCGLIEFERAVTDLSNSLAVIDPSELLISLGIPDYRVGMNSKFYGMCFIYEKYMVQQLTDVTDEAMDNYLVAWRWLLIIADSTFARSKHYSGNWQYPVEGSWEKYHSTNFREKWIEGEYAAARRAVLKELIDELQSLFAGE